jgi:hypothetical protein
VGALRATHDEIVVSVELELPTLVRPLDNFQYDLNGFSLHGTL